MIADVQNPGSYVKCVNAYETKGKLENGKVYKVHHTQFDRGKFLLKLVGVEGFWAANRFDKGEPDAKSAAVDPS